MVAENSDLHSYCVHRLCSALSADISPQQLCKVGVWTIGEYGDLLLTTGEDGEEEVNGVLREREREREREKGVVIVVA